MDQNPEIIKSKEPGQTQIPNSPEDTYRILLQQYVDFTQKLRKLERQGAPSEEKSGVDQQKSSLHRIIKSTDISLGKEENAIDLDILLTEGNLKEYDVEAPLIRLPMVGRYFAYDVSTGTLKTNSRDKKPQQALYTWDDKYIAALTYPRKGPFDVDFSKENYNGKQSEIEKWRIRPFYAIIFSESAQSYLFGLGSHHASPLHQTRTDRMKNLARDFSLNLFLADDMTGHQDYGSKVLHGIEVPGEKVQEIAQAMAAHPEKYWLAQEEIDDPYRTEFLDKEPSTWLWAYFFDTSDRRKSKNWKDWYNYLRVCHVLSQRDKESEDFKFIIQNWSQFKKDQQLIKDAIQEARKENTQVANVMRYLYTAKLAPIYEK